MPKVLVLINPNSCLLASPRKPNSAIGIVGTTAKTKNITQTIQANCIKLASTLNNSNKSKYCATNTTYLIKESNKILVNSFQ